MAGYYQRVPKPVKRLQAKGAEQDEFKIMKMQIDKRPSEKGISLTTVRVCRDIVLGLHRGEAVDTEMM